MKTVTVRLNDADIESLDRIMAHTGEDSASEVIRHLIRTWAPKINHEDSFMPEDLCLASASKIRTLLSEGKPVEPLLHDVAGMYRRHVKEHGWLLPPVKASLLEVLHDLRQGRQRLASSYLHAVFPSFWHAADGPAISAAREGVMEKILAYRMGLNSTGEIFDINWAEVRRAFIVQRKVVSFFQPSLAASLYKKFCPMKGRVWDPSGGFGARMLGFAAVIDEGTYFVNEPAVMTSDDLARLSAGLSHLGKNSVLQRQGSEYGHDAIAAESIDLVMTSPPYFGKEHYFDEPSQACKHRSEVTWVKYYLTPTLENAAKYLRHGGLLVLNTDMSEVYRKTADKLGFEFICDEALPVRRDHFVKAMSNVSSGDERLLVWRKK